MLSARPDLFPRLGAGARPWRQLVKRTFSLCALAVILLPFCGNSYSAWGQTSASETATLRYAPMTPAFAPDARLESQASTYSAQAAGFDPQVEYARYVGSGSDRITGVAADAAGDR